MSRGPLPDAAHRPRRLIHDENPRRKRKSPGWAEVLLRNPALIGWTLFFLLMLGGLVKFVATLPTPQEKLVRQFFTATQRGDYRAATALLEQGRFQTLAERSTLQGLPTGDLPLSAVLAPEAVIEEELRAAPFYTSAIHFELLRMQRDKDRLRKRVQFRIGFDVYTTPRAPLGGPPPNAYPFVLEGVAITAQTPAGWRLSALDFRIIPQGGATVRSLLELFGGAPPSPAQGP